MHGRLHVSLDIPHGALLVRAGGVTAGEGFLLFPCFTQSGVVLADVVPDINAVSG